MPDDILDDLSEAHRKLDAARQALEGHPELDARVRMAEELERIKTGFPEAPSNEWSFSR
jgi:hypothetical protein